jgi:hypothetical protein
MGKAVKVYLDDPIRHISLTSILPRFAQPLEPGPTKGFQAIFDIPHTVASQLANRLLHIDGLNELINTLPDRILLMDFNQLKMPLKEVARSIHEIIALVHQAASREIYPKAIDYTPSDEGTSYIDDTPDRYIDGTSE